MKEQPKIKYVLLEQTTKELWEQAQSGSGYSQAVYQYEIKHDDYTEEQKKIQSDNRWQSRIGRDIRYREDSFYEMIGKIIEEELSNGTRENLEDKVYDSLMNTKIRTYLVVKPDANSCYIESEYGDEQEDSTYIHDEKEMEKAVRKVVTHGWNRDTDVYIDNIEVNIYNYTLQDLDDKLKKLVKKYIRNEFTYCIKQNKIIVPEEYIAKGHAGIEEWRELKASKNNNNNMEKRMLRSMVRDKKSDILMQMRKLLWRFPTGQDARDWSVPYLNIYGSGNHAMAQKLVNQVLGKMTDQEILNLTDEEISKKFKEYWKGILTKAIEQIDDVITYGDN